MAVYEDIASEVDEILSQPWDVRDGTVVPTTENIALAGGAVKLEATMAYADLVDSTSIAIHDRRIAARVFKSFLAASARIVRERGGEVRSFDGDRIMAVFVGASRNTSAAKAALNINYVFLHVIKPKLEAKYDIFKNKAFKLGHCVGIDTSDVLVVRSGIRNNNDLVWVGRAPNVAAKLSSVRNDPYNSWMTADVYNSLHESAKTSTDGRSMWESRINVPAIPGGNGYRSSWYWKP